MAVVDYPAAASRTASPTASRWSGPAAVLEFLSYGGTFTGRRRPGRGLPAPTSASRRAAVAGGQSLSSASDRQLVQAGREHQGHRERGVRPSPPPATAACDVHSDARDRRGPGHRRREPAGRPAGHRPRRRRRRRARAGRLLPAGRRRGRQRRHLRRHLRVQPGRGRPRRHRRRRPVQAQEFSGQTQIASRQDVAVCDDGTAADLPAPAALDLPADDAAREPLEGMLVAPVDPLTVSEVFDLTSFGELTLSEGGVLVQPTELARPGTPEAAAVAAGNAAAPHHPGRRHGRAPGQRDHPPVPVARPPRSGSATSSPSPSRWCWASASAPGGCSRPTAPPDGVFAPQNTRPAVAGRGRRRRPAGRVQRAQLLPHPRPDRSRRGARTPAQFEKQAAKIVAAISALDADVVTLMEIEDTDSTGYSPGQRRHARWPTWCGRLNTAAGDDRWSFVPLPDELYAVDRDVIRNAIIYRNDVVQPVGDPGRAGRRERLVQRPRAAGADLRQGRRRLHRRRQPLQVQEHRRRDRRQRRHRRRAGRSGTATGSARRSRWPRSPTGCAPPPATRTWC